MKPITEQFPQPENDAFMAIAYTIGGMMVFPENQIERKPTINQARGFTRSIADRFDLTLECIRRHYARHNSPLALTLSRYAEFFALFGDFRGYVSFLPPRRSRQWRRRREVLNGVRRLPVLVGPQRRRHVR
jgi:hypothetical protein